MLEEEARRLPRQRISSLMGPLSVRIDAGHFIEGLDGGKPHRRHAREVLAYSTRLDAPVDVVNKLRAPLQQHLHKHENMRWQLLAPGS